MLTKVDRVVCISLPHRKDRLESFQAGVPADWPFPKPDIYRAIDGNTQPMPSSWPSTAGALGCYLSHAQVMVQCAIMGHECVLVLEDDAEFCDNFSTLAPLFLADVPDDADLVYLGGYYLTEPRVAITELPEGHPAVMAAGFTRQTHAYLITRRAISFLANTLCNPYPMPAEYDVALARLARNQGWHVYAPSPWLVAQRRHTTDVGGSLRITEQDVAP